MTASDAAPIRPERLMAELDRRLTGDAIVVADASYASVWTVNYLRSGRALDTFANVSIVKQGRRIVAFEARAWQDDADKPIATAFGHFMLRPTPGMEQD